MISIAKLLAAVSTTVIAPTLWKLIQFVYRQLTSNLRRLRGPKGTSWIYGNLLDIRNADTGVFFEEWTKQYGSTLRYKDFFNGSRLLTMDTRAIQHIITHADDYEKPSRLRHNLALVLGEGLIFSEGTRHHQQRHVLNPAFGPAQIRALTGTFLEKAIRLRDVWSSEIAKDPAKKSAHIDIVIWLNRMTLDVIGLAGFNYNFDSLDATYNEFDEAFTTMNEAALTPRLLPLLRVWFPLLRLFPTYPRKVRDAQRVMARTGEKLLSDAKAAAVATVGGGEIEKKNMRGRDLLSLLVKANMAADIPESQRLSDEDVLAQIPTFLFAGHETVSTATSWALYAMAKAPEVQTKLREELLSIDTDTPSMDELVALPYLDAVVRETLRVHSPVPVCLRIAMKDDILPVEKPYMDRNGVLHDTIRIRKGDSISIPILTVNRSCELWGPDAHEFKPERWENVPEAISHIPGVWSNLLSFLGGPRACIGYRFSLVEIKVLLFTLIRAFEFEFALPINDVASRATIVQRPVLRNDPDLKPQLPMLLRPYTRT